MLKVSGRVASKPPISSFMESQPVSEANAEWPFPVWEVKGSESPAGRPGWAPSSNPRSSVLSPFMFPQSPATGVRVQEEGLGPGSPTLLFPPTSPHSSKISYGNHSGGSQGKGGRVEGQGTRSLLLGCFVWNEKLMQTWSLGGEGQVVGGGRRGAGRGDGGEGQMVWGRSDVRKPQGTPRSSWTSWPLFRICHSSFKLLPGDMEAVFGEQM